MPAPPLRWTTVWMSVWLVAPWLAGTARSEDAGWPQFRGPGGQGHADARDLPMRWSETEHVAWKTPIPGRGWSSPVILHDGIWMTTAVERPASDELKATRLKGRPDANQLAVVGSVSLRVVGVDRASGRVTTDEELLSIDDPGAIHSLNTYASPTPVIEDDRLYCHFGTYGTVCWNTDARRIVWQNTALHVEHQNGPGSSPILWGDFLIFHCDGIDQQFVVALHKATGEVAWRTKRSGKMHENPDFQKAYATPQVIEGPNGRPELISPGADWVYAYDPASGDELWRAHYGKLGFSTVPRPVVGHGMVFVVTSYLESQLIAVRHGGSGDVTQSHVAWSESRQMPRMPSLLLVRDELYAVSDNGVATCLDARTGQVHWQKRLDGGNHSASPLHADGRVYFFNREGATTVIRAGKTFEKLATNELDSGLMASPAVAGNSLFLRTDSHLYRID